MKTINVSISDLEYSKFGLKSDSLSFSDLLDLVSREIAKQRLAESIDMAGRYGIATMSMADISKEVKAARKDAKDRN